MTQFTSPVGRLVQGSMTMQQETDINNPNIKLTNPDGTPKMSLFFALAFPKKLDNGQDNQEFLQFYTLMVQTAQAAWPALFPNGATTSSNPKFSWKYQDGDGVDTNGQSVSGKAGFAGNHIIKFASNYNVSCFVEGQFAPHQQLQKPDETIKRGYWLRVFGDMRSNNATGTQVPGISIYPSLVSFVARGEEIASGPDAAAAFGGAPVGYVPAGATPATSAPVGGNALPSPTGIAIPGQVQQQSGVVIPGQVQQAAVVVPKPGGIVIPSPPAKPAYRVADAYPGITVEQVLAQGWTADDAVGAGLLVKL